jgi:hypothetical protein
MSKQFNLFWGDSDDPIMFESLRKSFGEFSAVLERGTMEDLAPRKVADIDIFRGLKRRTQPVTSLTRLVPVVHPHSISSSVRTKSAGGTVTFSARAAFMLTTVSNLIGCSTGISAGFDPLRILST